MFKNLVGTHIGKYSIMRDVLRQGKAGIIESIINMMSDEQLKSAKLDDISDQNFLQEVFRECRLNIIKVVLSRFGNQIVDFLSQANMVCPQFNGHAFL